MLVRAVAAAADVAVVAMERERGVHAAAEEGLVADELEPTGSRRLAVAIVEEQQGEDGGRREQPGHHDQAQSPH
jgi:hypothetical protein